MPVVQAVRRGDDSWDTSLALFQGFSRLPRATATADLLARARPTWEAKVVARTSHLNLLFTLPGEDFPWKVSVQVESVGDDVFEFQLFRNDHLITADRATSETAPAVLDAFLMQLTGT